MRKHSIVKAVIPIVFAVFAVFSLTAHAGQIIGGSDLLNSSNHEQLETWLEQDFDLTNIFDKSVGDTSIDFHAAVDGMGATFSLIEIINGGSSMIIGGYNQDSWWSTPNGYNYINPEDSESFLFNLSTGIKYERNSRGPWDTYNWTNYGPTFGGGHDLNIRADLTTGYANIGHSYGDESRYGQTTYRNEFTGSYNSWTVGALEVFTLSEATTVPEPGSLLLFGLALLTLTLRRKFLLAGLR